MELLALRVFRERVGGELAAAELAAPAAHRLHQLARDTAATLLGRHIDAFQEHDRRSGRAIDVIRAQRRLGETQRLLVHAASDERRELRGPTEHRPHLLAMLRDWRVRPQRLAQREPPRVLGAQAPVDGGAAGTGVTFEADLSVRLPPRLAPPRRAIETLRPR